jgi:alkylation response protein AidB-like acyl-CoA dehydrogenase
VAAQSGETTQASVQADWIARARSVKPLLAEAAPRIEREKGIPADVLDELHRLELFRMLLPRSLGGAELDLATYVQAISIIAEGDASTAWCMAQTTGCSIAAAYLQPSVASELFGPRDAVLAWGFASANPPPRAVPAPGGWRVSGTWSFASGNGAARWLGGHSRLCNEQGEPQRHPDGSPVDRTMLFPRASAAVRNDVWDVIGLVGTGSGTYTVEDLFVPHSHSVRTRALGIDHQLPEGVTAAPDPERREGGVLYRISSQTAFAAGLTSVAVGIARAMLDAFIALARSKSPTSATQSLRDDNWVQVRVAQADARISAASAWLEKLLGEAWHEAATQGTVSFPLRMKIRLACTHQAMEAAEVAETLYREAGATAIFKSQPFERRFRDMHAACQQVQSNVARLQNVGQYYLGLQPPMHHMP